MHAMNSVDNDSDYSHNVKYQVKQAHMKNVIMFI